MRPDPEKNTGLDVHIWHWTLGSSTGNEALFRSVLNSQEQAHADRFKNDLHRKRYIEGRAVMRIVLARFLPVAPWQVPLCNGPFGKPELEDSASPLLHFNLSHSGAQAVLAVCPNCPVGIDIEAIAPVDAGFAEQFFALGEIHALKSLKGAAHRLAFAQIWTRKEAFLKAIGVGLADIALDDFEVSVGRHQPPAVLTWHSQPQAVRDWRLFDLTTSAGFCAALAVRSKDHPVRLYSHGFGPEAHLPHNGK